MDYRFILKDKYLLFVDTETYGIPQDIFTSYKNIDNWPTIKQIAWIVYTKTGQLVSAHNYSISVDSEQQVVPPSYYVPKEILPIHEILKLFQDDLSSCDVIVGHNIDYDVHVIMSEMHRFGYDTSRLATIPQFCTMRNSVKICNFDTRHGDRYPKLQELYSKLFHRPFENAHDAYCDIKATAECFWEIFSRDLLNEEDYPFLLPKYKQTAVAERFVDRGGELLNKCLEREKKVNDTELQKALELFEKALHINSHLKDKVGTACIRYSGYLLGDICNESFFVKTNKEYYKLVQESLFSKLVENYKLSRNNLTKDDYCTRPVEYIVRISNFALLIVKCYFEGIGTRQSLSEAKKWIEEGFKLWPGLHPDYLSGFNYYLGMYYEKINEYEKAVESYSEYGCVNYCPAAAKQLGILYLYGKGCKKSKSKAREYLTKAQNKGLDVVAYLEQAKSWF